MKNYFLFLILFSFLACNDKNYTKVYPIASILNDASSKVWVTKRISYENNDFTPKYLSEKDVFIFYESGVVLVQPFKLLGQGIPKRGKYNFREVNNELSLYFDKEAWHFNVSDYSKNQITLEPSKLSDFKYSITLESLPEF